MPPPLTPIIWVRSWGARKYNYFPNSVAAQGMRRLLKHGHLPKLSWHKRFMAIKPLAPRHV